MTSQWMQMSNSSNGPDKCWCARICEKKRKRERKERKARMFQLHLFLKIKMKH